MNEVRLQKFLSEAGIASRRRAEEMITEGKIEVNGVIVKEMGSKVVSGDIVKVEGKQVSPSEKKVYILLNKPAGYITTSNDQFGRRTVLDLVENEETRVYPVGRLDYDTSGLLLLTNDGELTFKLTHPSHQVDKVYIAEVQGFPTRDEINLLRSGIEIDDFVTSPAGVKVISLKNETTILEITIHEGKNRQVRKMCEAAGHPVLSLMRRAVGSLELGNLKEGEWRFLTSDEVESLFKQVIQ